MDEEQHVRVNFVPKLVDAEWSCKRTDTYGGMGTLGNWRGLDYSADRVIVSLVRDSRARHWRITLVTVHGVATRPGERQRRINVKYSDLDLAHGVAVPDWVRLCMTRSVEAAGDSH